jgi:hypothetical protein
VKLDRPAVVAALHDAGGNIGEAARSLKCSRRTLQNRLHEYGMVRSKGGRPKRHLSYGRRTKMYAVGALAAAGLGYLALRKGSSA